MCIYVSGIKFSTRVNKSINDKTIVKVLVVQPYNNTDSYI